jgi:hypothetical protein
VGPSPESEIARLERQLRELLEEAAATEVVAKQETTALHTGVRRDPWRGWTAVSVALGLLVAVALALPTASLFTTPMDDPNCHVPMPRGDAMRKFNQAFPGLHGSQP